MSDYAGSVTDKYSHGDWGEVAHTYGSAVDNPIRQLIDRY
jgi:hypothetical protein